MPAKRITVTVDGKSHVVEYDDLTASPATVHVDGRPYTVEVVDGETVVKPGAQMPPTAPARRPTTPAFSPAAAPMPSAAPSVAAGTVIAPMPGNILDILVKPGERVTHKQDLCILEAMKMKNVIRSPRDGIIAEVRARPGRAVAYGDVLFVFE